MVHRRRDADPSGGARSDFRNAGVEEGENPYNTQTLEAVNWNAPTTKAVLVEPDLSTREEEQPIVDQEAFWMSASKAIDFFQVDIDTLMALLLLVICNHKRI